MKLLMKFELAQEQMTHNYRFVLLSWIKKLLSAKYPDDYGRLYEGNAMKSYTFSVFFPGGKITKDAVLTPDKKMNVTFSGCEPDLIIKLYNAALGHKGQEYPTPNGAIKLVGVHLSNPQPVISDQMVIKFLSPLLVRQREQNRDTYLKYDDEGFHEYLNISVGHLFASMGKERPDKLELTPLKAYTTVVKSDNRSYRANCGTYLIKGNPQDLSILYSAGLGARRSEGFGMMEIVEVNNAAR